MGVGICAGLYRQTAQCLSREPRQVRGQLACGQRGQESQHRNLHPQSADARAPEGLTAWWQLSASWTFGSRMRVPCVPPL